MIYRDHFTNQLNNIFFKVDDKMTEVIKKTNSICPECQVTIPADYVEEDGQVFMVKACKDHGSFKDLISINAKHFRWIQQFTFDSDAKMCNPQFQESKGCPHDCGICSHHKSAPAIAIMDLTYRCNLKCPICFANALSERGKNIEPSMEDIRRVFTHFRKIEPQPPACAMYAGGEPTLRDDFPEILQMCTDLGYLQRQVATNGIRFAKDIDFLKACIDGGLNAMYLQFDGLSEEVYQKMRGAKLMALKQQVIDNCRELGFHGVILTPTVAKGVNDQEVTKIFDYATANLDVVSTISYQPIALCGRFDQEKLFSLRYTSSHIIEALNKHTNGETGWMYPMSVLSKFAKVSSWLSNQEVVELTCNAICGYGTFVFVDPKTKKVRDIHNLFDIPKFYKVTEKWYNRLLKDRQQGRKKFKDLLNFGKITRTIGTLLDKGEENADKLRFGAEILTTLNFRNALDDGLDNLIQRARLLLNTAINSSWQNSADFLAKGNNLLVALMQFQDGYDFDCERASRCLVHYGYIDPKTNQVLAVPFCPMNTLHRTRIENELLMAQAVTKEEEAEVPVPQLNS
jgi:uncharacterized radical SAM superfamily Fe-S cluster-containing enzyme